MFLVLADLNSSACSKGQAVTNNGSPAWQLRYCLLSLLHAYANSHCNKLCIRACFARRPTLRNSWLGTSTASLISWIECVRSSMQQYATVINAPQLGLLMSNFLLFLKDWHMYVDIKYISLKCTYQHSTHPQVRGHVWTPLTMKTYTPVCKFWW